MRACSIRIHRDPIRAVNQFRRQLPAIRLIGSHGVDVGAWRNPLRRRAPDLWRWWPLPRPRRRARPPLPYPRLRLLSRTLPTTPPRRRLRFSWSRLQTFTCRNGFDRQHGRQLASRLEAGADDAQRIGIRPRHVARGEPARRARSNLPKMIGFHERQWLGVLRAVQQKQKVRSVARVSRVNLGAEIPAVARRHVVQDRARGQDQTPPRLVDGFAARQPLKGCLHELDSLPHRKQLANVRLGEIEHACYVD